MDIVLFLLEAQQAYPFIRSVLSTPKGSLQSCWRTLAAERAGHRPETHHGYLLAVPVSDPHCRRADFRRRRPHPGGSGQESAVHLSGRGRSAKARRDDFDAGAWAAGRVPAGTRLLVCAKRHALSIKPYLPGASRPGSLDGGDGSFMHYHFYAFPLLAWLELFVRPNCNPDGYMDLDVLYFSELDTTWNHDELAFFTNPEAAAVANPIAAATCTADAASSLTGKPLKQLFWCAGSWGTLYPLSGHQNGGKGVIRDSSLLTARVLAALHRRGLSWRTMGADALCKGVIDPLLPKTQYQFTLLHPVPETYSAHVIGELALNWGIAKIIPAVGQDPIYTIWRWNDCCTHRRDGHVPAFMAQINRVSALAHLSLAMRGSRQRWSGFGACTAG